MSPLFVSPVQVLLLAELGIGRGGFSHGDLLQERQFATVQSPQGFPPWSSLLCNVNKITQNPALSLCVLSARLLLPLRRLPGGTMALVCRKVYSVYLVQILRGNLTLSHPHALECAQIQQTVRFKFIK